MVVGLLFGLLDRRSTITINDPKDKTFEKVQQYHIRRVAMIKKVTKSVSPIGEGRRTRIHNQQPF